MNISSIWPSSQLISACGKWHHWPAIDLSLIFKLHYENVYETVLSIMNNIIFKENWVKLQIYCVEISPKNLKPLNLQTNKMSVNIEELNPSSKFTHVHITIVYVIQL